MLPILVPAFVPGFVGGPELLIVLAIAVLLFGANKLPSLARSMGQAGGEFKRGREEVEQDLRETVEGEHAAPDADRAEN